MGTGAGVTGAASAMGADGVYTGVAVGIVGVMGGDVYMGVAEVGPGVYKPPRVPA